MGNGMKSFRCNFPIFILIGVVSIAILEFPVNANGGQAVLNPIDDTYVDWWNDYSNYGARSELKIGASSSDWADYLYHTWLKFDLSSIPSEATGITATLELYECSLFGVSETHNVSAYMCHENSWSEYALKWENMPFYNRTLSLDCEFVHTSDVWYSWNVTKAIDNSTTLTVVLEESWDHEGAKYVQFNSKEAGNNIPRLTIRWTGEVPEFPSFLILPLFMVVTLFAVLIYRRKH